MDTLGAAEDEAPRIEAVTFPGAEALPAEELRVSIVTQATRCRATFVLWPFCALTDWSAFWRKEFLDLAELERDELRLEVLYFRRGYRDATVRAEVLPADGGVEVAFRIDEGVPTILGAVDVVQMEPRLPEKEVRRAQIPGEGEPLDLIRLEAAMFQLTAELKQAGHLDARVTDSIDLAGDGPLASLEVVIDPGPLSTLESFEVEGNESVSDAVIAEAFRLRPGRVLRSGDIVAGERSLYESNLFHEAHVRLPPQADSAKRLEIEVREAPPRSARAGLGFNTVDFGQVEASYIHYNWVGKGRRLNLVASVGNLFASQLNGSGIFQDVLPEGLPAVEADPFLRPTWQASADVLQPGFLAADNRVGVGVFAHRRSLPGIVVDQGFGASASLTRRVDFETPVSLEYRFETTSIDAGDLYFCASFGVCDPPSIEVLRGRHRLSPIGLAYFSDRADDPLSPRQGYRVRVDLEHASALTMSDFRYNRIQAETARYWPLDLLRTRVLATKLRVGWVGPLGGTAEALGVDAEGLALLHPRRRFYAGGARSVRGFGENQLGPRVLTVALADLLAVEVLPDGTLTEACTPLSIEDGSCDPNLLPVDAFTPRPIGGSAVLEGSVEYRAPFLGPFQGAAFVDAAIVGTALGSFFSEGVGAVTPGVGIRWSSSVVPIRIDLGYRPALSETLPVLTEIVGPNGERRLVRLEQMRSYDPVRDGGGGFFQGLFAHLRLHVWIGEAY